MTNGPRSGQRAGPSEANNSVSAPADYSRSRAPASPLHRTEVLAAALDYAAQGLAVFPCIYATKEPAVRRGFYSATTNPATIRRWFGGTQNYNLAVRTGAASGVWVLDIDAGAELLELEDRFGPLPPTRTLSTANGRHLWFRADGPIPCSVGRVASDIDVRGDGGSAMVPPSIHPTGVVYEWLDTRDPVPAPEWLVTLTRKRPAPIPPGAPLSSRTGPPGAYGAAALDREIDDLARVPPGQRNHALNRASFCLHQLVAGGELDSAEVERRLIDAAVANGLMTDPDDGPRKTIATIRSGARAGLQHPRSRPAP